MIRSGFLNTDQRDELEQIVRRPSEAHGVARRANATQLPSTSLRRLTGKVAVVF